MTTGPTRPCHPGERIALMDTWLVASASRHRQRQQAWLCHAPVRQRPGVPAAMAGSPRLPYQPFWAHRLPRGGIPRLGDHDHSPHLRPSASSTA